MIGLEARMLAISGTSTSGRCVRDDVGVAISHSGRTPPHKQLGAVSVEGDQSRHDRTGDTVSIARTLIGLPCKPPLTLQPLSSFSLRFFECTGTTP